MLIRILTKNPKLYANLAVKGQLEFSSEQPLDLVSRLEDDGFTHALLVGGGTVNWLFLQSGLVNELLLTIEPVIFGAGNGLFGGPIDARKLELLEQKQLNGQGTLMMRYKVH